MHVKVTVTFEIDTDQSVEDVAANVGIMLQEELITPCVNLRVEVQPIA